MPPRLLFGFVLLLLPRAAVYAQATSHLNKQVAVENGLPLGVVFADSEEAKFTLRDRMQFYQIPSVSVAVIDSGKIVWAKAYGSRDVATSSAADVNTLYQTASISKAVNAVTIAKLAQARKIDLRKDVRKYLKSWPFPDNHFSAGRKITLAQLLSHTAGLSTEGFFGYAVTDTLPTLNQILSGTKPATSEAVHPIAIPGTAYHYSGGGITLTRKILEDRFQTDYASLVQAQVLGPLDMTRSTYAQHLPAAEKNFAAGYVGDMQKIVGDYHVFPELAPDGLWSSATAIGKLVVAIQAAMQADTRFLKKATTAQLFSPVLPASTYTLGFVVEAKGEETYFSHRGANYGYRSVFYGSMKTGKGIVVLTNSENGELFINELVNSVAIVYDWKGFHNPPVKKVIKPDRSIRNDVSGTYTNGEASFRIQDTKGQLEMTGNAAEALYYVGEHRFFLVSSPTVEVLFSKSAGSETYLSLIHI